MKIFGYSFFEKEAEVVNVAQPKSTSYQNHNVILGAEYPVINKKYDGEKTLGELGVVVNNVPDYYRLRLRSYNAYATIDTFKTIASKYFYWKIGSGLKLQSEPNVTVLKSEGLEVSEDNIVEFQKVVEARFMIWANSNQSDYLKQKNLHELASDFDKGAFLGGDNLLIVRFEDNGPTIQFVSGEFVCNPGIDTNYISEAEKRGNKIFWERAENGRCARGYSSNDLFV